MIKFNIGNNGQEGLVKGEGAVALIAFQNGIFCLPSPAGHTSQRGAFAAEAEGRFPASAVQELGDHGGGGGLAMGAADAD